MLVPRRRRDDGGDGSVALRNRDTIRVTPHVSEEPTTSFHLLDVAWRRRVVVVLSVVVSILLAFAYLWNATPIYRSDAQVYIERSGPRIISNDGLTDFGRGNLLAQIEIMRSTALLDATLRSTAMQAASFPKEVFNPIEYMRLNLNIRAGDSDIISVSFKSPVPEDNKVAVNSLIEAYIDYHNLKRRSTAAEVLKILRDEKRRLEEDYDKSMQQLLAFRQENVELALSDREGGNVTMARLAQLSQTLTAAQMDAIDARVRFEAAQKVARDPQRLHELSMMQMQQDPAALASTPTDEERRVAQFRIALVELRGSLGENHPRVVQLRNVLKELEFALGGSGDRHDAAMRYLRALATRHEDARSREAALQAEFDQQRAAASSHGVQLAELAMIESAARRTDRQIDIIDSRIKELNVTDDTDVMNISILEPASESELVSPNRPRVLAMALVVGLIIGLGGAFLLEFLDDGVHSVDEIERLSGLPVLGVIPQLGRKSQNIGTIVHSDPTSIATEGYRTIRTAIHFGTGHSAGCSILITSAMSNEGKSVTASNLAIAFAQVGSRTILLDADCRKPVLHRIWETHSKHGLSSVLVGDCGIDEAICATGVPNLDLLPCGPIPPHPVELLNSPDFVELLEKLGERYNRIIIDSAPVGPVTDSRIVAALVDATVVVAKAELTSRRALTNACAAINRVGGRPIGLILNGVSHRRGGYGYYHGYYGAYGYGGARYGEAETVHGEHEKPALAQQPRQLAPPKVNET